MLQLYVFAPSSSADHWDGPTAFALMLSPNFACLVPVMYLLPSLLTSLMATTLSSAAFIAAYVIAHFIASDYATVLSFLVCPMLSACLFQPFTFDTL